MHVLISHLGNDSLLHRVTNFQTTDVREHALEKADKLIEINDLTSIKQKSPAAGTFYVIVPYFSPLYYSKSVALKFV
jgi:polysaccharide pyruvyl transferase WcaK-like protein